jgi:hypothetical protein
MENKKFLAGGKLGDFFHCLSVCKFVYDKTQNKSDILLSNNGDTFLKSLTDTKEDLYPVLSQQEWFNSLSIYENEDYDINLSSFRHSRFLYQTSWIDLLFKTFFDGEETPKNYKWISIKEKDNKFSNSVLINRSLRYTDSQKNNEYQNFIKNNNCYFICFEKSQYESFEYKNEVELLLVDNLYDFVIKLNSCKFYVGNLTGPTAIATAMDIPRFIELPNNMDRTHYMNDKKYYDNFNSF